MAVDYELDLFNVPSESKSRLKLLFKLLSVNWIVCLSVTLHKD